MTGGPARWRAPSSRSEPIDVEVTSARGGISTSVLLRRGERVLVVDCGDGTGRDLADRGVVPDAIDALVVTHDHPDHTGGVVGLLTWLDVGGRTRPLPVLGPALAPLLDALLDAWARGPGARADFEVTRAALVHEQSVAAGPFRLTSFPVRHRASSADPPGKLMEVHGLRVLADGARIVISSDTGPCARLTAEAAEADLAVVEATFPAGADVPPDTHLKEDEAAAIGRLARAYLLYHRR